MAHYNRTNTEPKFTRGEKCIFIHLVITFLMIIVLVIIYGLHLYFVSHTHYSIFNTRRTLSNPIQTIEPDNSLVGYLFLNLTDIKFICNTLLLKPRWSLSPAHCVVMRTKPDLAHLLFAWGIKYRIFTDASGLHPVMIVTHIRRSIAHPYFDRDSFANNIGLLEHSESVLTQANNVPSAHYISHLNKQDSMFIVGWEPSVTEYPGTVTNGPINYAVYFMSKENCLEALSPIIVMRNYEFCVTLQKTSKAVLEYGAVIFNNSKPIGFFSWGERLQNELPLVVINDTLFQDWLQPLITF